MTEAERAEFDAANNVHATVNAVADALDGNAALILRTMLFTFGQGSEVLMANVLEALSNAPENKAARDMVMTARYAVLVLARVFADAELAADAATYEA